jgi:hypothetical protein
MDELSTLPGKGVCAFPGKGVCALPGKGVCALPGNGVCMGVCIGVYNSKNPHKKFLLTK